MAEALHTEIYVGPAQPLVDWVAERIGPSFHASSDAQVVALLDETPSGWLPRCVVVFDDWTTYSVDVSIAADGSRRWARRCFIHTVYDYAFRHAGKVRMNMVVATSNAPAVNMHRAFGHHLEGTLRNWFGEGKDALLYSFTPSDWANSKWNLNKDKTHG